MSGTAAIRNGRGSKSESKEQLEMFLKARPGLITNLHKWEQLLTKAASYLCY